MKCIPTTKSGRFVAAASCVTEIEEVFVAIMARDLVRIPLLIGMPETLRLQNRTEQA